MSIYDSLSQSNTGVSNKSIYDSLTPKSTTPQPVSPGVITSGIKSVIGGVKTVASDVNTVWNAPEPAKVPFTPENVLDRTQNWGEAVLKSWSDFGDSLVHPKVTDSNFATNAIGAVGNSGVKFIQAFFTPVSNLFEQASTLPGPIGTVASKVNKVFAVAGTEGADALEGAVNALPVSQETKDTLTPLFRDVGALGAQIVLGKGTDMMQESVVAKTKSIIKTLVGDSNSKQIPVTSEGGTNRIPINNLEKPVQGTTPFEPRPLYEPYTPTDQLPIIQMGSKVKSDLPTIQIGEKTLTKVGGMTYESINDVQQAHDISNEAINPTKESPALSQQAQKGVIEDFSVSSKLANPTPIEGTGGVKIAKSASDINTSFAEKGFGSLSQEEQAKYTPTTKAEQIQKVSDIMSNDMPSARQMITGEKAIPNDVLPQVLFNAMEEHAVKNSDVNLLRDLANSPIATKLSEAGQALGSHGYNDNPNSPVKAIRDVTKAREEAVKGRVKDVTKEKKTIAKEIDKEIKAVKPSKQSWGEFVKSIQC